MDSGATEREILEKQLEKKLQDPTAEPLPFTLEFLKVITCNFSAERELGRGAYGVVYKGVLRSGKAIAIKKICDTHLLGDDNQVKNEIICLAKARHQNVVQLVGYCVETKSELVELSGKHVMAEKRACLLCFEFLSNGSLDKHLSDDTLGLDWDIRYEIIRGVCRGLHYLHDKCHIIHLDLKPQNILMDAMMMPKIADFGLSRVLGEQTSKIVTKNFAGTLGYMAQEYIDHGIISSKADIFSLGVIIIEIITGHRDYTSIGERNETSLKHYTNKVVGSWRNRTPIHISPEMHIQQVEKCISIALICIEPESKERPTSLDIVQGLDALELESRSPGSSPSIVEEDAQDLDGESLLEEIRERLENTTATVYYGQGHGDQSGNQEDLARVILHHGYHLVDQYVDVDDVDVTETLQQQCKNAAHPPGSSRGRISAEFFCGSRSKQQKVRDTWYILENQIPFFVLEKIMHHVTGWAYATAEDIVRREFTSCAHRLLNIQRMCISRDHPAASKLLDETAQDSIFHLLHLLHKLLKPHDKTTAGSKSQSKSKMRMNDRRAELQWHRATEYRMYANVDFKGRDIIGHDDDNGTDVLSVLDVRMEGCNVVIPCLHVNGDTRTILLNLMALEGQHPQLGTYVTAYCLFMSQIACTKEDVELLEARGVIDRYLGTPSSVAADFSKLCDGVVIDRSDINANYLKPLWHHVDKRYTSRQQNVIAWLKRNCFTCRHSMCLVLGVISVVIILVAVVVSAFYIVFSFYSPK